MAVPYTFANAAGFIPLSELDANFATTPDFANAAGNITVNAQPNITSVGTLTNLVVSGNITGSNVSTTGFANITGNVVGGNLRTVGFVSATGNVTGNFFVGNGSLLTGIVAAYSNANVAAYLPTYSGNLASLGGNVQTTANISATGTIRGGNFISAGTVSATGAVAGNTIEAGATVSATGNVIGGNVLTAGQVSATGNVNGGNVNVSSIISVNGNVQAGNLRTAGQVSATGNISGGNATVAGLITGGNIFTAGQVSTTGNVIGGTLYSDTLISAAGNVRGNNINSGGSISAVGNILGAALSVSGNATAGNVYTGNILTDNYRYANGTAISFAGNYSNANVAAYLPTYSGTVTANVISASGNVTGAGIYTAGVVSAAGNITGSYFLGNGSQLTGISLVGNVTGNAVQYTAPFGGASTITGTSKWSQFVSVLDFGADPTGTNDSRGAFQAALNTAKHVYIPTGNYKITDRLLMLYPGQMMSGDGRSASVLKINSSFNLSANAVIDCSSLEPGAELRDFGVDFTQPDTTNRASLTTYPVVIKATNAPRTTLQNLKIQAATNGIDLTGNSGGTFIELLEMSAFGTGISIDGSYDTIRINNYHFWPYNLTTNQQAIFFASPTRGFSVGRVDGLFIDEYLNISNLGLFMFQSTLYGGDSQVFITNSAFDSFNGINQTGGHLQVTNSYITISPDANLNAYIMSGTGTWAQFNNCWILSGSSNQSAILMQNCNACTLNINQCHFNGISTGIPYIYTGVTVLNNTQLSVSDSEFVIGSTNGYVINGVSPSSNTIMVHFLNNLVRTAVSAAYSNPMFRFNSGYRVYLSGNRSIDKGSNPATFISVAADNYNWVSGNMSPGWTNSFPAAVTGYYSNNLT
jgi:hypothetical protein